MNARHIKENCLSVVHPDVVKLWHPTKNGKLTPSDFTYGSDQKVWWKCPVADDHEWPASIREVVKSNNNGFIGCPCCTGHKVVNSNCLATTHPERAKLWHPTKNGNLTPYDVGRGSHKKVWWKCPVADDHEWFSSVINVVAHNTKCSCCSNYTVVLSNCLATTHPERAKLWHPTKNGNLTPYAVVAGSDKKVWWKCPVADDHEWYARIKDVVVATDNCPCCLGRKVVLSNCLATTHPERAKLWHPTKNGNLTPYTVVAGSNKKVWWKCPVADDHEWFTTIYNVIICQCNCACCVGKKIVLSNCLATMCPEHTKLWHPTKNGNLTPYDVLPHSSKKVWWKCAVAEDHEWEAIIASVTRVKCGCPCCSGHKIVLSNCLATTHPERAKLWHPTKNGNLTPYDVGRGSHKKVWWQCVVNNTHIWPAQVKAVAITGCGCPHCNISKGEQLIKKWLQRQKFKFIHQYKCAKCKNKLHLAFDFAVFHNNLIGLIEFQGVQHYKPIAYFRGENGFKQQQLHDKIKRNYCQTHDIPLLEIPYWLSDDIVIEKVSQFITEELCNELTNTPEPQIEAEKSYALCASE